MSAPSTFECIQIHQKGFKGRRETAINSLFQDEFTSTNLMLSANQPTKILTFVHGITRKDSVLSQNEDKINTTCKKTKSMNRKTIDCMDDFDRYFIRRIIQEFVAAHKTLPTFDNLFRILREKTEFELEKASLLIVLNQMGYKLKKTQFKENVLMERNDIVLSRTKYLRAIKNYRITRKNFIYLDETWVDSKLTFGKRWQKGIFGVTNCDHVDKRLIVVSAANSQGFVPNSILVYIAEITKNNCRDQLNQPNLELWLKRQLLPYIGFGSVVIFSHALYQNFQPKKPPNSVTRKEEIIDWLVRCNMPFHPNMRKCELLEIIRQKNSTRVYSIDRILEEYGHIALPLPPYHGELNPIELIWSDVKRFIQNCNIQNELNITVLMEIITKKISSISAIHWKKCCEYVESLEQKYWDTDNIIEEISESLIFSLDETTDAESETSMDTDEE